MKPYIILILLVALAFANSLQNSFVWDDIKLIVENSQIDLPLKEIPSVFITGLWKAAGEEGRQLYYRPIATILSILNYKIWGLNPLGFHLTNILLHLIGAMVLYRVGLLLFTPLFQKTSMSEGKEAISKSKETYMSQGDENVIPRLNRGIQKGKGTGCPIKNPCLLPAGASFGHDGKEDYRNDNGQNLFSNDKLISLIGASIFAVHPIHNESVGRPAMGESLFGFFIILSLYFFLREKKYLSWFVFLLALLSKETAVMLPFALVILSTHKRGIKRGMIEILPYIVLVGIYLILRVIIVDTVFGDRVAQPIPVRILTMAVATFDYIRLLLIPYPLSPFYPARWYTSIFEPKVLIATIFLILVFVLTFKVRRDRVMLFLLVFPFLMLAPVIWRVNTFCAGPDLVYIAERYLYVPLMAFSFFISASAIKLFKDITKKYLIIAWLLVIITFTIITTFSTMIWKSGFILFDRIVRESPDAVHAHNDLGLVYDEQGQLNEAIQEYKTALRLRPDFVEAHNNIGVVYAKRGQVNKAIQEYKTALRLMPDFVEAHNNLGIVYYAQGQLNEAIREYKTALRLKPDYVEAHNNLGLVYYAQGQLNEAIQEYKTVLRLKPDFVEAHNNLGIVYYKQGIFNMAIREYKTAARLKPDYTKAYGNLGDVYMTLGITDKAIVHYQTALRLNPNLANIHNNLGLAYKQKGLINEAIREFQTALKIQPDHIQAHQNLELLKRKKGN